ncbi:MAG TPA: transposase [Gracilimonas sp.]|uniref:hypothetical protein n=1 Tax=Gracilimonas sp. TaxID=1974203 RepID=UPI002D82C0CA|nr:transposase [Gracilimonas sp.]
MQKRPQYFSDSFKLGVIQRVVTGEMTKEQARIHYDIGGSSAILNWMRKFGYTCDSPDSKPMEKKPLKDHPSDPSELKKQLTHTQKLLEREQLRSEFYQTMIDIAERELGISIRKKSDTKL